MITPRTCLSRLSGAEGAKRCGSTVWPHPSLCLRRPPICFLFVLFSIALGFKPFCYAEFASMTRLRVSPVPSGSS